MTRRYLLPAAALLLGLQQLLQFAAAGPTVTTAPCPQLDGLKCSNLGAPPVVPCSTEGSEVEAEACRRRQRERERKRHLTSPVNSVNDCSGSAYASEGPDDKWYCGVAGACQEWVAAPGWTTVALDGVSRADSYMRVWCAYLPTHRIQPNSNPPTPAQKQNACPTVPASDSPVAVAATTSVTTQSQGGLVILTVELSRPASGRRRLHRLLEQAARAARALWGNTKSKVPANYALRLDLPSRLNGTYSR